MERLQHQLSRQLFQQSFNHLKHSITSADNYSSSPSTTSNTLITSADNYSSSPSTTSNIITSADNYSSSPSTTSNTLSPQQTTIPAVLQPPQTLYHLSSNYSSSPSTTSNTLSPQQTTIPAVLQPPQTLYQLSRQLFQQSFNHLKHSYHLSRQLFQQSFNHLKHSINSADNYSSSLSTTSNTLSPQQTTIPAVFQPPQTLSLFCGMLITRNGVRLLSKRLSIGCTFLCILP